MHLPPLMLWAWQRPEDLSFLDSETAGVAYLAGTIRATSSGFPVLQRRLQPLRLPPGAVTLPVVRIESGGTRLDAYLPLLSQEVGSIAAVPNARGLQIDFDARASEQRWYRSLLMEVSRHSQVPVGITALASWCASDQWLLQAPVAEAVPMLFRMGVGANRFADVIRGVCADTVGLSTDEPWPLHRPPHLRRVYLFSPRAWTADSYKRATGRLRNWH